MDVKEIYEMAPWQWPEDAGRIFKGILDDRSADPSDRLLAVEMAGDCIVVNDELAKALLTILNNVNEPDELRCRAAIAFGPALEESDLFDIEFDDPEEIVVSEKIIQEIQTSLRRIYEGDGVPKEVRRRVLEAAVRAPQDWHSIAIRDAFADDDEDWRLTAVFCMQYIRGFDQQVLEVLKNGSSEILRHAVEAAGNWEIKEAWPYIDDILSSAKGDKWLTLAAIEAASNFDLTEAVEPLTKLLDSDDEDITEAVYSSLSMIEAKQAGDEYNDEDDDEDGWGFVP